MLLPQFSRTVTKCIALGLWLFLTSYQLSRSLLLCGPPPYEGAAYCVALCLSVCLSVRPSRYRCHWLRLFGPASVTSRHLANYNDTHVVFGTHWGPHIVRPSRPHKFLFYVLYQHGADFCLPSLRIRSMPFLGASSDLVTRLATLQCQIW